MKLLFLSKRKPQGRDIINRPYGRFFHLPRLLAERGHEVHILLMCYDIGQNAADIHKCGIHWYSRSPFNKGSSSYLSTASSLMDSIKPDWVIGCSDTYYGILAEFLGFRHYCHSIIDAYDNYESYLPWCTPLHYLWRRAVSRATVVTAAGPQLAALLQKSRPGKPVYIVPMAADSERFFPQDKTNCRKEIYLPLERKIIGYCGSIYRNRGMQTLFDAYNILNEDGNDIDLVLTGRKSKSIKLPSSVKWLGYIPDEEMPFFLNSLDAAVIVNRISRFGSYSYPVKLYEAMKCQIPLVATDTPSVHWILKGNEQLLSRPDDPCDLADKIKKVLSFERMEYGELNSWEQSCLYFEEILLGRI